MRWRHLQPSMEDEKVVIGSEDDDVDERQIWLDIVVVENIVTVGVIRMTDCMTSCLSNLG